MAGGDIASVRLVDTDRGDRVVVKTPPYDARVEADGLAALRAAGAPVPQVLYVDGDLLVLEYLQAPTSDGAELGRTLAAVHAAATDATFGWERDNLIGALPQVNTPDTDWPSFYVDRRIRPFLHVLPDGVRTRMERACEGPMRELLEHDVQPALVHGDLWSGNVIAGRWLIDPAIHRADREFELAFATLFGGLPPRLLDAYLDVAALDPGWDRRRPALQLYHLLVHVAMFGQGWLPGVVQRLELLGW